MRQSRVRVSFIALRRRSAPRNDIREDKRWECCLVPSSLVDVPEPVEDSSRQSVCSGLGESLVHPDGGKPHEVHRDLELVNSLGDIQPQGYVLEARAPSGAPPTFRGPATTIPAMADQQKVNQGAAFPSPARQEPCCLLCTPS